MRSEGAFSKVLPVQLLASNYWCFCKKARLGRRVGLWDEVWLFSFQSLQYSEPKAEVVRELEAKSSEIVRSWVFPKGQHAKMQPVLWELSGPGKLQSILEAGKYAQSCLQPTKEGSSLKGIVSVLFLLSSFPWKWCPERWIWRRCFVCAHYAVSHNLAIQLDRCFLYFGVMIKATPRAAVLPGSTESCVMTRNGIIKQENF